MPTNLIALSDVHCGEHASVMSYDGERRALFQAIREFTGGDESSPAEVDTIVLIGDVPEKCLSTTDVMQDKTTAFMKTLLKAVTPKKIVYLFGNHDHTLWRDMVRENGRDFDITPADSPLKLNPAGSEARAMLAKIFFNYPDGSLCRSGPGSANPPALPVDFYVGNYLYHEKIQNRSYLFTHGHHWRWDVTHDELMEALSYVDKPVIGHDIIPPDDPHDAVDIRDLERRVHEFADTMWSNDLDEDMSRKAFAWFLKCNLTSLFKNRSGVNAHTIFRNDGTQMKIESGDPNGEIRNFREKGYTKKYDGPTSRFREFVKTTFRSDPDLPGLLADDLTLVYGDTHDGGYDTMEHIKANAPPMRIYNTGAWVTHNHFYNPPGFFFGVKDGEEYMVEVAHCKDSLKSASRDSHHLWESLGIPQKLFLRSIAKSCPHTSIRNRQNTCARRRRPPTSPGPGNRTSRRRCHRPSCGGCCRGW